MKATLFSLAFICLCVLVSCQPLRQIFDEKTNTIITMTRSEVPQNVTATNTTCDTPNGGPGNGVCNGNGVCVNDTTTNYEPTCVCISQYTGPQCAYLLKEKLTAFLLSFFVGAYGADRFYLGYTGLGVGKLILGLMFIIIACAMCCAYIGGALAESEGCILGVMIVGICLIVGCFLASFGWWLADWIRILMNAIPDSNGVPLGFYDWS